MMGSNRRDWLTVNCMELGPVYARGLLQIGAWRLVWGAGAIHAGICGLWNVS